MLAVHHCGSVSRRGVHSTVRERRERVSDDQHGGPLSHGLPSRCLGRTDLFQHALGSDTEAPVRTLRSRFRAPSSLRFLYTLFRGLHGPQQVQLGDRLAMPAQAAILLRQRFAPVAASPIRLLAGRTVAVPDAGPPRRTPRPRPHPRILSLQTSRQSIRTDLVPRETACAILASGTSWFAVAATLAHSYRISE